MADVPREPRYVSVIPDTRGFPCRASPAALEKESVAFFKKQAKKQKVPYQRMIKNLLAWYQQNWQKVQVPNITGR